MSQDFEHRGSYIDSLDWIKKKKATINQKHKDDKCFLYAATVASNYREIKWNPEIISNIESFTNKKRMEKIQKFNCS